MRHPKHLETDDATSKRMSKVKLKRGKEELALANALWHAGYRYILNDKNLPGSPDIAIRKYHIAVFVDGEFWHGYEWDNKKPKLKRNREYWIEKIEENMARDVRVDRELIALGWVPVHFWTKEINTKMEKCVEAINELTFEQKISREYYDD